MLITLTEFVLLHFPYNYNHTMGIMHYTKRILTIRLTFEYNLLTQLVHGISFQSNMETSRVCLTYCQLSGQRAMNI